MRDILHKLSRRQHLSRDEARAAFDRMMAGDASDAHIAALLMGLAVKGVSPDELTGAAEAMRDRAVVIPHDDSVPLLDTCGTGGDVKGTFNISTAAAILVAACGVKVVKHGNRSASGKFGSADVLEKLGLNLDLPIERLGACLEEVGICFAFARNHHPAMKHVAAVRSTLGIPTIFNLLGPLSNPARAKHQLIGVFSPDVGELMARTLLALGSRRAWVVHAEDGLDELSTLGPTRVWEVKDGDVVSWTLDPASLGLDRPNLSAIQVDSVHTSADMIRDIVNGKRGPARDIAVLNAAAGLVITGDRQNLADALSRVDAVIASGAAQHTLAQLIAFA